MRKIVLAAVAALSLAGAAQAQNKQPQGSTSSIRPGASSLSGWLVFDPGSPGGIGLGGRFALPILPEGVFGGQTGRVREELNLEIGGDYVHWSIPWRYYDPVLGYNVTNNYSMNAVDIVAGVAWNWWLTPKVALYPKFDLGYRIAWASGWDDTWMGQPVSWSGVFPNGAFGAIFKLAKASLRVEAGSHMLRIGLGMAL